MDTSKLKKFAQYARSTLMDQVAARLEYVLNTDSAELRDKQKELSELKKRIQATSKEAVIERTAYMWFNRFCALRFMDVNRYSRLGIVSPAEGNAQPEILAEAKQGHIDDRFMSPDKAKIVFGLLSGARTSANPQAEAYRLLLVAACNYYHSTMPYLFERIDDYSELLLPEDMLSPSSILSYVRESLTPDACQNVEVIGWLYQYYISAKKDKVFEDLKKKKQKVTPENIPAATQLFTPHWIVRYLVENSLGRLWMLNHPASRLKEKMDYYIAPQEAEADFLKISSPEEIKICDPACGSGHMLTYAFDLLYAIYEEQGYDEHEIPEKILTHNLFGIEIDERAGSLAAFALSMKAREKSRRFLEKGIEPNICVLQDIHFTNDELKPYIDELGRDLFSQPLLSTLKQFEESSNFGSLIQPELTDVRGALQDLTAKNMGQNMFLQDTHRKVLLALKQADFLSSRYHVVVANPPYMGGGNMNGRLAVFSKEKYPNSKSDLFSMFIERNLDLSQTQGLVAMITMQSWMFLSSFEKLRTNLLHQCTILSMAHLGARAFDSIGGEVVSTAAFVIKNFHHETLKGQYLRLVDGVSESEKAKNLRENLPGKNPLTKLYFTASAADFKKIPGGPIAYWVSESIREAFHHKKVGDLYDVKEGLGTRDDPRFLRYHWEVEIKNVRFLKSGSQKWVPTDKAGGFRKWFGSNDTLMNWLNDGEEIRNFEKSVPRNTQYFFQSAVSWGKVATGRPSFRYRSEIFAFVDAAPSAFGSNLPVLISALNSNSVSELLKIQGGTINVTVGVAKDLPLPDTTRGDIGTDCIDIAKTDWDSFETSWDFTTLPLLENNNRRETLGKTYGHLRHHWQEQVVILQNLEEQNNRIFIEAYGLQDELKPYVPLNEITLTCNPHYRYGGEKTEQQLEASLLADTMQEFIHYAVGCMFGRYSLDKPGLILANQSDGISEYKAQISNPIFEPDADNVLPVLDENWFSDDIVERFQKFLRVTFGEEHYKENLEFIEQAIGKPVRKYFTKDFYDYHVRRFKKRPIYWMFSSPKGSFNALIYMHRYKPDTVSVVLNDYLRDFRAKLQARLEHEQQIERTGSDREKVKATKEISRLEATIRELNEWEHDTLYPLAGQRIHIDLDDGVKVNYPKFGAALKPIKGLGDDAE